MTEIEQAYFLTVDWCQQGKRGIFLHKAGHCFRKNDEPHTEAEIYEILGPFTLILAPQSELFTEKQLAEYNQFIPLAEYSNQFGIAVRDAT